MSNPVSTIPKLNFIGLSNYIADLILIGIGEGESVSHPLTRKTWHLFFFSIVIFIVWYFAIRVFVAPSFKENTSFYRTIRFVEILLYIYLLCILAIAAINHYKYMLLPGRQHRFVTLIFFYIVTVFLFSRIYYSLFNYDSSLFKIINTTMTPVSHFGIQGFADLKLSIDCLNFSFSVMLALPYYGIEPYSTIVSGISISEALIGLFFTGILVATFIQTKTQTSVRN